MTFKNPPRNDMRNRKKEAMQSRATKVSERRSPSDVSNDATERPSKLGSIREECEEMNDELAPEAETDLPYCSQRDSE